MVNCRKEAYRLMLENGRIGEVLYVPDVGQRGHAYYVPNPDDLDVVALNHKDNGYTEVPELTVREVKRRGRKNELLINVE